MELVAYTNALWWHLRDHISGHCFVAAVRIHQWHAALVGLHIYFLVLCTFAVRLLAYRKRENLVLAMVIHIRSATSQPSTTPCKLLSSCVAVIDQLMLGHVLQCIHITYVPCSSAMHNTDRAADRLILVLGPQRLGPVSVGSQSSAHSSSRQVSQTAHIFPPSWLSLHPILPSTCAWQDLFVLWFFATC